MNKGVRLLYSARFTGEHASDHDNNMKLLESLKDISNTERGAQFCCAAALFGAFADAGQGAGVGAVCRLRWHPRRASVGGR